MHKGQFTSTRRARFNNKQFQDISFNTDKFISEKTEEFLKAIYK